MARPSGMRTLVQAARDLRAAAGRIGFPFPVHTVYNPLMYAWEPHRRYLETYGGSPKKVVFVGMNPGPWGMAQTGVPFGEVDAVRGWLHIEGKVGRPTRPHLKRPVNGFSCRRSEVSGRRLWGLFRARFVTPACFFADHFVANYCPLLFMDAKGANLTPDKLGGIPAKELFTACDRHLQHVNAILKPQWFIGVGRFAEASARRALPGMDVRVGHIPHPSPASPAANRNWAEAASCALQKIGVWE